jgi:hypothetical protein
MDEGDELTSVDRHGQQGSIGFCLRTVDVISEYTILEYSLLQ